MKYAASSGDTAEMRRSPCGERGLKWQGNRSGGARLPSLPVRGAWIEIVDGVIFRLKLVGRSPCGERGLKLVKRRRNGTAIMSLPVRGAWIEIAGGQGNRRSAAVAPRAGSVD